MKKGAMELSLGFIVMVVFAVILLSLAIFWVRGFFVSLEPLTVDLTQQAQSEISKTFQNTDKNFAVWPSRYTIAPGKRLILAAGIKNNDEQGNKLYFAINMRLSSTNAPGVDIDTVTNEWVLVPGVTKADASSTANTELTLNIPANAKAGSYLFSIYACYGETAADAGTPVDCNIESDNLWGSPQPVTIIIES